MLTEARLKRKKRIRAKIIGTAARPRLSIFRSNKYFYSQLIDDLKGHTLAESHGVDVLKVAKEISEKAKKAKVSEVVFDRSGYRYHGKVQKFSDAAREGGLKF